MKNVNQKRKYSNFKQFNDACYTAVHEAKDVYVESLGATVRTGGEIDFIKMDSDEIRTRVIDRNRRKLEKLAKNVEVEGLVTKLLGRITDIKSPEEPKHPNG
jgi:hypothetical protein